MKIITILLFSVLLNACGGSKAVTNLSESVDTQSKLIQENLTIEYRAHSRGSLNKITLENKIISIQTNFEDKPVINKCSNEDWNKLAAMVSDFNLRTMSTLEAPSKAHQYDGAPITTFKIIKDGQTFEVPPFDAGNPNKEIAPFIEMVLNIANLTREKN